MNIARYLRTATPVLPHSVDAGSTITRLPPARPSGVRLASTSSSPIGSCLLVGPSASHVLALRVVYGKGGAVAFCLARATVIGWMPWTLLPLIVLALRQPRYDLASFLFLGAGVLVRCRSWSRWSVMHLFMPIGALKVPPFDKDRAMPVVGAAGRDAKI